MDKRTHRGTTPRRKRKRAKSTYVGLVCQSCGTHIPRNHEGPCPRCRRSGTAREFGGDERGADLARDLSRTSLRPRQGRK